MNNTEKLKRIDALLADVPPILCLAGCSDCCGPIAMTRLEKTRICQRIGQSPKWLRNAMLKTFNDVVAKGDSGGSCPLLKDGRCSVYDIRPAICRVFGSSDGKYLTCPHGCSPETPWTESHTFAVMNQIDKLGY
jgi:Fe-S-cluster containining protein